MKTHSVLLHALSAVPCQADPLLTSWFTVNSGQYARIYTTAAAETAATKFTTWSGGAGVQASPVCADVSQISYSASWVYIRTSGLASHVMGPWYMTAGNTTDQNLFLNYPSNTASIYRIPRNPTVPVTKTKTGGGTIGRFVNGVSFFDNRDAFSYVNSNGTEVNPGDGRWARNAYPVEGATFDAPLAHQAGNNYHYHVQPIALRYQLGDHVNYDATSNRYTEGTAPVTQHSPILAWAADGFRIYGPYGYSNPTNAASGVRRMISGFTLRNGSSNTTNLATTGRITLPAWAAAVQNRSTTLTTLQYGPAVSTNYGLGRYLEDHDFLGDLGFVQTTGATVRDFDLDKFNGRICVTPEFPSPHFCYFTTINANGTPAFPYTMGRTYYGDPTGGTTTISETVATYFNGGPNKVETANAPAVNNTTGDVALTWIAVEVGTYLVEASDDLTPTITATSDLATAVEIGAKKSHSKRFYRVSKTSFVSFDTNGFDYTPTGGGGTTAVAPGGTLSRGNTYTLTINIPTASTPPVPPVGVAVNSVTIGGSATGISSLVHASQYVVTCTYAVPAVNTTGAKNFVVNNDNKVYTLTAGLTVN